MNEWNLIRDYKYLGVLPRPSSLNHDKTWTGATLYHLSLFFVTFKTHQNTEKKLTRAKYLVQKYWWKEWNLLTVFCYQNRSDLLWEKIVLVIKKNFGNSRLKAENLQNFWDQENNLFEHCKVRTTFGNKMLFYLAPGGFSD